MAEPIPFDEPCPCGSGAPYKECCGRQVLVRRRQRRNVIAVGVIAAVALGAGAYYMLRVDEEKLEALRLPEGAYFDEFHQHWHDANHQEVKLPGKIWSKTELRWLNINDQILRVAEQKKAMQEALRGETSVADRFTNMPEPESGVPEPEDAEAPRGQVWSERHGHYHDQEYE